MSIGRHIKFFRISKGLTQEKMSLGICSISYLSKVENGAIEPSQEIVSHFCTRLDITLEQFMLQSDLSKIIKIENYELLILIRSKEDLKIKEKNKKIQKYYHNVTDPEVFLIKAIFELRYNIYLNESEKAKKLYNELQHLKKYQTKWTSRYFYRFCGLFHYYYGSFKESITYYLEAEQYTPIDEHEEIFYQLALAYNRVENIVMSNYYNKKALDIFSKKMKFDMCVNCNFLAGVNNYKIKNLKEAKQSYMNIIKEAPATNINLLSKIYHNLGLVFSEEGDSDKAILYYKDALKYKKDSVDKANTLYLISKEFLIKKDKEKAKEWLNQARGEIELNKNIEYTIKIEVLNFIIFEKEQSETFERYLTKVAIPHFESKNENKTLKELINHLIIYYERDRQYKSANKLLKKLINMA